jgi:hypothetical protein
MSSLLNMKLFFDRIFMFGCYKIVAYFQWFFTIFREKHHKRIGIWKLNVSFVWLTAFFTFQHIKLVIHHKDVSLENWCTIILFYWFCIQLKIMIHKPVLPGIHYFSKWHTKRTVKRGNWRHFSTLGLNSAMLHYEFVHKSAVCTDHLMAIPTTELTSDIFVTYIWEKHEKFSFIIYGVIRDNGTDYIKYSMKRL